MIGTLVVGLVLSCCIGVPLVLWALQRRRRPDGEDPDSTHGKP